MLSDRPPHRLARARPRLVFIVGSGRCGSSLVQEVVSRHVDVGFLSNLDDRLGRRAGGGRANGWIYRRVPQELTRKGRVRYAPSEGYQALAREVSPLVCSPGRPLTAADATPWLAGRLRGFFVDRAAAQRRPVFLHKFTGWPRVGLLDATFDDVRFINVVRDGRAVASSLTQMPWWNGPREPMLLDQLPPDDVETWTSNGRSFPLLAGLEWKAVVGAHEQARGCVSPDRWLELRYEDLLDDPQRELHRVVNFLGLSWTGGFDRQVARQQFGGGRRDAFRHDLSARDLELLERHLAGPLRHYGYGDLGAQTVATASGHGNVTGLIRAEAGR